MWLSPISPSSSGLGNLERLLAVVRLRHQQVIHVHAKLLGIGGIERMLGIHECSHAAGFLRLGDYLQRDRRFAGRFRPEDLNHAAAGKAAHAERGVKRNRAGRNHRNRDNLSRPQPHDGAFAKLLFDLRKRQINRPAPLVSHECFS
jgi:hypothetical protein